MSEPIFGPKPCPSCAGTYGRHESWCILKPKARILPEHPSWIGECGVDIDPFRETEETDTEKRSVMFKNKLRDLINSMSLENETNTPDWILAQYLSDCLDAFETVMRTRDYWFGIKEREKR